MGRALCLAVAAALLARSAGAATTIRTKLRRAPHGVQVRLTPFTIAARHEREVCQAIALDDSRPLDVTTVQFASPRGRVYVSHHFALFVDDDDALASLPAGTVDTPGCVGFGRNFGAIIGGVQSPRGAIRLPAGVGFTFQPHQVLLLNLHYINASSRPLTVDGAINLLRARPGSVVHHARGFQLGTTRIDVPAGTDGSAGSRWIAPFPMNVVFMSTHSHKHTTAVDVSLLRAGNDAGPLVHTVDYRHAATKTFDTPLRLDAGDGFQWTCRYHNDTAAPLHFGITSEDEMCFAIGSFYLDDDAASLPAVPGCFGGDVALTCPGF